MGPIQAFKTFLAFRGLQKAWNKTLWRTSLMGWKTILGAVIVAASGALTYLEGQGICNGCDKIGEGLFAVGTALGLVGLRHTVAKGKLPIFLLACFLGVSQVGMAQTVTQEAQEALSPRAERRRQQVEEAKDLLREKAKIEKRMNEIVERLAALDNDAEPLSGITFSGNVSDITNCLGWSIDTIPATGGIGNATDYKPLYGTTLEYRLPEGR